MVVKSYFYSFFCVRSLPLLLWFVSFTQLYLCLKCCFRLLSFFRAKIHRALRVVRATGKKFKMYSVRVYHIYYGCDGNSSVLYAQDSHAEKNSVWTKKKTKKLYFDETHRNYRKIEKKTWCALSHMKVDRHLHIYLYCIFVYLSAAACYCCCCCRVQIYTHLHPWPMTKFQTFTAKARNDKTTTT